MNVYEKIGMLMYGLATSETHVTFGKETSIVAGELYALKVSLIYGGGTKVVSHRETFSQQALENMSDPQVVADAILSKLKAEVKNAQGTRR